MNQILEISTRVGCSLSCGYCPQAPHVMEYAKRERRADHFAFTFERFRECLVTVPNSVEIHFAGMAEPWLNDACTDMLLWAHESGHGVCVYTTCAGMTRQDVERIKHVPMRIFCVHLPDVGGQMKLKVTLDYLDTIKAVKEMIPQAAWMSVGETYADVKAMIETDVYDGHKILVSRAGNLKDRMIPRKTGRLKRLPCMEHNVLLPNGDVVLCCMDYGVRHTLGNLLRQDYASLFTGPEFQTILRGLEDESIDILCRNCEIAECDNA